MHRLIFEIKSIIHNKKLFHLLFDSIRKRVLLLFNLFVKLQT
jgi:hypothetical protein